MWNLGKMNLVNENSHLKSSFRFCDLRVWYSDISKSRKYYLTASRVKINALRFSHVCDFKMIERLCSSCSEMIYSHMSRTIYSCSGEVSNQLN